MTSPVCDKCGYVFEPKDVSCRLCAGDYGNGFTRQSEVKMTKDEIAQLRYFARAAWHESHSAFILLEKALAALPDEPTREPSVINAEGSQVMMELFNRMPVAALKAVPEDIAKRVGDFMVANGYRFVFDRWYLQAEPNEPVRSAPNRSGGE